jgi:8-oxo-dGTP pyrophosphatase MutT (NUDIX family)
MARFMICYPHNGASMTRSHRSGAADSAPAESLIVTRHEGIERLRRGLHSEPHRLRHDGAPRAAAVLVPIVHRGDDLHFVFIRRSDSVESHRGQVAFPGGRVDPTDTTLLHTALREAHEEVGIEPHLVDVLGGFPTMSTVASGMQVAPFVGFLRRPVDYRIQEIEVAQVFEVPLRALADKQYRGLYEWRRDKDRASSHYPAIFYGGQTIWGLTLRITESVLEIMGIPRPA